MSGIRTSNSEASPGIHDQAFDESIMTTALSQAQEECRLLLQSPVISKHKTTGTQNSLSSQEPAPSQEKGTSQCEGNRCGCTCINSEEAKRSVLETMVQHLNMMMADYFHPETQSGFQSQLEFIV